ncbi:hypothetical protein Sjap_023220 [Stephania japonica]|uniref:Inactive shikimate kinase like 1, chloroplastic n=1 Tax=Stephania japonica TaxID=461633 RepID=A0AAP0HIT7_9MAGN
MAITLVHSSCRNLHFRHPPLQYEPPTPSHTSLTFSKPLPRHPKLSVPKKSVNCTNSQFQCSHNDEFSGVELDFELSKSLAVKTKAMEISSELKGTSVFLVGMDSTMKADIGKVLADALRYYYFDSNGLVEQLAGGDSTAKSLIEGDEKGFHESETEVLKQLSSMGRLVVCTGAGAVHSSTNLAFLRHGLSIWIDVPLFMLGSEVLDPTLSVSSSSEVLDELTELYERMKDGYATADAKVSLQKVATELGYDNMESVSVEDMAFEALKEIEKLTRVKKMMEAAARPF